MKKGKAIRLLRKRLAEAMRLIAAEHICDGCSTVETNDHEPQCKYAKAISDTQTNA